MGTTKVPLLVALDALQEFAEVTMLRAHHVTRDTILVLLSLHHHRLVHLFIVTSADLGHVDIQFCGFCHILPFSAANGQVLTVVILLAKLFNNLTHGMRTCRKDVSG